MPHDGVLLIAFGGPTPGGCNRIQANGDPCQGPEHGRPCALDVQPAVDHRVEEPIVLVGRVSAGGKRREKDHDHEQHREERCAGRSVPDHGGE